MTRAIVVTVGISLIQDQIEQREGLGVGFEALPGPAHNLRGLDEELKRADESHLDAPFNPEEEAWREVRLKMVAALDRIGQDHDMTLTPPQRQQYLGAELASLKCLGCERLEDAPEAETVGRPAWDRPLAADDVVILLASDTAPGIFCARVIQEVLAAGRAGFPMIRQTQIQVATGLRPESREQFLAAGLPAAARILFDAQQAHGAETLLIGSGGYKGLLPYLTPVAMHLGVPLLYLYEESSELLTIQPLPLTLDLTLLTNNESAFAKLAPDAGERRRPTCAERLFWLPIRKYHPEDEARIRAWGWVEPADAPGELRLSATGVLAWLLAYHGYRPERPVDARPAEA